MEDFKRLLVYQKSRALSSKIAAHVRRLPPHYRRTLGVQLDNAVESIGSNIAEGAGRKHRNHANTEFVRYLHISVAEANEVEHRLNGLSDRQLLTLKEGTDLIADVVEVRRMIIGLIKYLERNDRGRRP